MSGCKIGPGGAKHVEQENTSRQSCNVLIGIGAILIAITRMMKGL
jgi:hypothetical protein